jgi:hypothetical protein
MRFSEHDGFWPFTHHENGHHHMVIMENGHIIILIAYYIVNEYQCRSASIEGALRYSPVRFASARERILFPSPPLFVLFIESLLNPSLHWGINRVNHDANNSKDLRSRDRYWRYIH